VRAEQLHCPRCQAECAPVFFHSVGAGSELLARTVREIGLPAWDVVWARRGGDMLGWEISGDRPFPTNPLSSP
jgi:hypothetical protein